VNKGMKNIIAMNKKSAAAESKKKEHFISMGGEGEREEVPLMLFIESLTGNLLCKIFLSFRQASKRRSQRASARAER
jgi:hypothetical protein